MPLPPAPVLIKELSPAEKLAKEQKENPTVDENGEHIQTVAEAKIEAAAMQKALDDGVAAVDNNIAMRNMMAQNEPAQKEPEPVDDGHVETVEEVKAKMKAAQAQMDADINNANAAADQRNQESAMMPDMGALSNMANSIHKMGLSQ